MTTVAPSVKLRGKKKRRGRSDNGDQLVRRRGRLWVINKLKPRNKQRQG